MQLQCSIWRPIAKAKASCNAKLMLSLLQACRAAALGHGATVLLLTALLANQHLYLKVARNWQELMSPSKLTVASK